MLASLMVMVSVVSAPMHFEGSYTITSVDLLDVPPPRWCTDRSDMPQVGDNVSIRAYSMSDMDDRVSGVTVDIGPTLEAKGTILIGPNWFNANVALPDESTFFWDGTNRISWTVGPRVPGGPLGYDYDCAFYLQPDQSTYSVLGDSNHDGAFDSGDLVTVFIGGQYEDGLAENSSFDNGDWNADREFDSGDLVVGFQGGHYESGAAAVAVPEPRSLWLILSCVLGLKLRRNWPQ